MTKIAGKVVAVTGASSGIGRALGIALVQRGAHVALSDVNAAGLAETASLVKGTTKVTTHVVDVRDWDAMQKHAADVEQAHGGADIIINNAGLTVRDTIESMPYADFKLVMDVNLWGVVHGTKAFFPLFRKRGAGHFVNISSINGIVPFHQNGPYNMSKYAVYGLNETLMQELQGDTIKITSVHPGGVRTNIAHSAKGMPAEVAAQFDKMALTSAAKAADIILNGVEKNRQRVFVGVDAKVLAIMKRVMPAWTVKFMGARSADPTRLLGRAKRNGA
jgi:NAD(P)-dependent dehydrogenase (short-subunit alcohol dehydrogenase family)